MRRAGVLTATVIALVSLVAGIRRWLIRQAALARRRIGKPLGEDAVDADRVWRRRQQGSPIPLLFIGDSLAAGLGATRRKDTLGGRLARRLARRAGRPVRLRTVAVVGAESKDLAAQLDELGSDEPIDVAVVIVVGTCPDLGALRPVPQPLRVLRRGCRDGLRPLKPSPRPAVERGSWTFAARWGRTSSPSRTTCSPPTASIRRRWDIGGWPRRSCPPSWPSCDPSRASGLRRVPRHVQTRVRRSRSIRYPTPASTTTVPAREAMTGSVFTRTRQPSAPTTCSHRG